ncbi:hypothetical protein EGT81_19455 [Alcaligenes faecalis]|uniref:hypothetical protein n=1 Tax=Alcaligenes faecalis TaxID=511 RepID=UPI000F673F3F|nr:hypothetical protein [Alcaligenes faecalis]RSE57614.1 hypothetical protein EGT81_19455 [Alcaligenes faecalis]
MTSETIFLMGIGLAIILVGILALYLINLVSEDDEKKPASEEKIREAISRYPNIKNMISDQLDTGKILTAQDLNRMIADCHSSEHNEAIRQRQLSNLNN